MGLIADVVIQYRLKLFTDQFSSGPYKSGKEGIL